MDPRAKRNRRRRTTCPLCTLEEVRIERGADEVRVYARTWRVDRTTPYTRADVATGDQNTNLYRAFFGRRFAHGEALQLAAEQYSTQPERALPSTDGLHLMLRLGKTRGPWKGDLFAAAQQSEPRTVGRQFGNRADDIDTIPGMESSRTTAYARIANGDPDRGPLGSADGRGARLSALPAGIERVPARRQSLGSVARVRSCRTTSVFIAQYRAHRRHDVRPTSSERRPSESAVSEGATSSFRRRAARSSRTSLGVSLFAEGKSALNPSRIEATARLAPIRCITLLGSASRTGGGLFERMLGDSVTGRTIDEAGVYQPGLIYFYPGFDSTGSDALRARAANESARRGGGPAARSLGQRRARAARRDDAAPARRSWSGRRRHRHGGANRGRSDGADRQRARPALQGAPCRRLGASRGTIRRASTVRATSRAPSCTSRRTLLNRFPTGNFGLLASLAHEYRSRDAFPLRGDSVISVPDSRTLAFTLEIRIQTAVVSYQFRNLLQQRYALVPGFRCRARRSSTVCAGISGIDNLVAAP